MDFLTNQEKFWAGEFGDEYIGRNSLVPENLAAFMAKWNRIVPCMSVVPSSILEVGSNIGLNLRTLRDIFPKSELSGVEINSKAAKQLSDWGQAEVYNQSIFDFSSNNQYDLVFTSGVLIHINPDQLASVYKKMYSLSRRYIIIIEYYNPTPIEVSYRGHAERLYKRDFAGEMMDMYPGLTLNGYGFMYHRDPLFDFADLTWFVLEK
ncbi:hypothetical protein LJB99_02995 [Deltaproteobacteria bacterium OttesenSCG-928-K17]|nr:hypothetical protein [Deltaproteobacteria bacterium OttesenSCG-928-K17]